MSGGLNSFLKEFEDKETNQNAQEEKKELPKEQAVQPKVNKLKLNISSQRKVQPPTDEELREQQLQDQRKRLYEQQLLEKRQKQEEYNQQQIQSQQRKEQSQKNLLQSGYDRQQNEQLQAQKEQQNQENLRLQKEHALKQQERQRQEDQKKEQELRQRPLRIQKTLTEKSKSASSEEAIRKLFYESETNAEFKEEWVDTYMKGLRSTKKNATVRKIISGRFRIMSGGRMEILPELKTHNMSSMDLLNTKWLE